MSSARAIQIQYSQPIYGAKDGIKSLNFKDSGDTLADGGAAMTAYARMQFTEMSQTESDRVSEALLKYCELDTFAMVLIYEYWANEIKSVKEKAA